MSLTTEQFKALHHIVSHGDDKALNNKQWRRVLSELHNLGLIQRRIGDWSWVPTERGKIFSKKK